MAKREKSDLVWTSISKKNLKSTTYFAKFDVKNNPIILLLDLRF